MNDLLGSERRSDTFSVDVENPKPAEPAPHDEETTRRHKRGGLPGFLGVLSPRPGKDLARFNADVAGIEAQTEDLLRCVADLKKRHEETKLILKAEDLHKASVKVQNLATEGLQMARRVKESLDCLDASNVENRRHPGCAKGSDTDRHRAAVTQVRARALQKAVTELQEVKARIAEEQREAVARRITVVTGVAPSEEDVNKLINSGRTESLMQQAVMRQGQNGDLMAEIFDIEKQGATMKELLCEAQALGDLFNEMAAMVQTQQEILDVVDNNVGEAAKDARSAVQKLGDALKIMKDTRKWRVIGVIIALIVFLILALVIANALGAFSGTHGGK